MDEKELAEIELLAKGATPGPWEPVWNWESPSDNFEKQFIAWGEGPSTSGESLQDVNGQASIDADFIAAARADVPALVAEVRRLKEALEVFARRDHWTLEYGKYAEWCYPPIPGEAKEFTEPWEFAEKALRGVE